MRAIGSPLTLIKQVFSKLRGDDEGSVAITDRAPIAAFSADPNNTFLISFPRTGSHWLRMLMELYFERPSLVRVFYFRDRTNYLTLHTHDLNLDVERSHVIYLYRDPVDTIFSQLLYHRERVDDVVRIVYWSDLYGRHLDKWLYGEHFTKRKTTLSYEELETDLVEGFRKVAEHFHEALDVPRLTVVAEKVTKDEVRRKTRHDPHVVQSSPGYEMTREAFRRQSEEVVWRALTDHRTHLLDILPYAR